MHSEETINSYIQYQEQFRVLIETFPDGILVHRNGKIIFMNHPMAKIMGGSTPNPFLGKNISRFLPEDVQKEVAQRQKIVAEFGHIGKIRHKILRVDDQTVTVDSYSSKIMWDGEPAFQIIIKDVTHEVRTQELLDSFKTGFRSLFEGTLSAICIFDRHVNIYDCNDSFCDMIGHTKKEVIARKFTDFTPEKWLDEMKYNKIRQQVLDRGYSDKYIKEYRHKDGNIFPITAICLKLGPLSGKNTLYCEIACNKAILKETEEKLEFINETIEDQILPVLEKLRASHQDHAYINLLEERIKNISEYKPSDILSDLTPQQKEICNLIKQGLSSKEISKLLTLSIRTIHSHRENIRKKLGLVKNKQSLTDFLNELN